jgi:MATE family multidrug resistance protein
MNLDRPLLARILRLGTPVVLGTISATTMGLIDMAMVGRLGPAYLAAVGLATNLFSTVVRTTLALGQAAQTLTARRVGESREAAVGEVVDVALTLGVVVGVAITVLMALAAGPAMGLLAHQPELARLGAGYIIWRAPEALFLMLLFVYRGFFEGIGRTAVPALVGVVTMLCNVALNWCLIYGKLGMPRMEARGAGLASALATLIGALLLALLARSAGLRQRFDLRLRPSLKAAILRPLWRVAWPGALRTFLVILSFTLFLAIIERLGTVQLAASNGVILILSFSFMPAIGVGTAVATLVGQSLGRHDVAAARRTGWHGVLVSVAFMGIMGVLFLSAPRPCLRLFTNDPEILDVGVPVLRLMGLVQMFDATGLTLAGAIGGAGHTRLVMLADVGSAYLLFLPLTWLIALRLHHGLMGAWLAAMIWFFVFAVLMVLAWARGGWARVRV